MKLLSYLIVLILLSTPALYAQETPESVKSQADSSAMAAQKLMYQAKKQIENREGPPDLKMIVSLYAEAGRLFEQAAQMYESLGPERVDPQNAENARMAMHKCIEFINQITKHQ